MNKQKLTNFRLWDSLDKEVTRNRFSGKRRESLYPSEASVISTDPETNKKTLLGSCQRKSWYRLMGYPQSEPFTPKSAHTFEFGKFAENYIIDLCKKAGIYNSNSVKFWDKDAFVSGELDVVVQPVNDNDGYIFLEVKSTWGGSIQNGEEKGKAKGLFDHHEGAGKYKRLVKGKPKIEHLLQLVVYLYNHKDDPNLYGGKIVYILRDNLNRTEFDVWLEEDGEGKNHIYVNDEKMVGFTAEDIYVRFEQLRTAVRNSLSILKDGGTPLPPERDYELYYSKESLEEKYANKEVSKTAYENHIAGKYLTGDWQCSYCSFKSLCWNLNQNTLNQEEENE